MSVIEQLHRDVTDAMKSGDKAYLSALRMLLAAMETAEKESSRGHLTEDQEVAVLAKEKRRRLKTSETYRSLGQDGRARREEAEARIIEQYLPAAGMSDEELSQIIDEVIAEMGAADIHDMGAVMSRVMPRVANRIDGAQVSSAVKKRLSGKEKPRPKT